MFHSERGNGVRHRPLSRQYTIMQWEKTVSPNMRETERDLKMHYDDYNLPEVKSNDANVENEHVFLQF